MGSFTQPLQAAILNHLMMKTTWTAPTNLYVALSTTTISDDGSGVTEPDTADGYARVETDGADWVSATTATPSVVVNANTITFPTSSASWGTIIDFALYDNLTSGIMQAFGTLTNPKVVNTSSTPSFEAGNLSVTLN